MASLDGKMVRDNKANDLARRISALSAKPRLAIVQVGSNEESNAYVRQKVAFGRKIGCEVVHASLLDGVGMKDLLAEIGKWNDDPGTHGVIVQLPLPARLDREVAVEAVAPEKDVDGLTSSSVKRLFSGDLSGFVPATAKGILTLLDFYGIPVEGKRVTIVGRSNLVGKPAALAFLAKGATVTVAHSKTADLAAETRRADILVVAAGSPRLIGPSHVSPGQTVIDVGITAEFENDARKLVGDVDFAAVEGTVGAITPVPGGVGPLTVLSLFENVVQAAEASKVK